MHSKNSIDLNADVGEGTGNDAALFGIISSANIACGAHAGNETTMRACISLALQHGVAIGAHPGFADRENMGRATVASSPAEVYRIVQQQVELLLELAVAQNASVSHVKAHGSLYNLASRQTDLAVAMVTAIVDIDPKLRICGLPNSCMQNEAKAHNVGFIAEAFVDRNYDDQGFLVPRTHPHAMVQGSANELAERAVRLARGAPIQSVNGNELTLAPQTLCVHGDTSDVVDVARSVRAALLAAGIHIAAPSGL
jgi:5-oxoprolinase (ATP-hydrolysing) subunit A